MRRLASITAISSVLLIATQLPAVAAEPEEFDGNVTTCQQAIDAGADFTGTDLDESVVIGTISDDGTMLDVELVDDSWTITAVVVKGGNGYMVYTEPPYEDLVSPLNDGGQIPQISHWFACGEQVPPPTDEPTVPPTDEPTATPTATPTDMATPTATPTTPAGDRPDDLPDTGVSPALMLVVGVALIGGAALALRRRLTS